MIEALLELTAFAVLVLVAGLLGISFEFAEAITLLIVVCALLVIVARSAYRDACRTQRWPGKKSSQARGSNEASSE